MWRIVLIIIIILAVVRIVYVGRDRCNKGKYGVLIADYDSISKALGDAESNIKGQFIVLHGVVDKPFQIDGIELNDIPVSIEKLTCGMQKFIKVEPNKVDEYKVLQIDLQGEIPIKSVKIRAHPAKHLQALKLNINDKNGNTVLSNILKDDGA